MEIKGERRLAADRATVWSLLNDPEVLRECVSGCEGMVATGEHSFDVVMNAAVGPVKARFKGELSITDINAPVSYRLRFNGQSAQAGFARGEAQVTLQESSPSETTLTYTATLQIGGKLAQVGSRLIDAAASATADGFFANFAGQFAPRCAAAPSRSPAEEAPRADRPGFWSWVILFFRHLLRKS